MPDWDDDKGDSTGLMVILVVAVVAVVVVGCLLIYDRFAP